LACADQAGLTGLVWIIGVEEPVAPGQRARHPRVAVGDDAFDLTQGRELVLVRQVMSAQARDAFGELAVGAEQRCEIPRAPWWSGEGWGGHSTSLGWAHTGQVAGARVAVRDHTHP
jgi:hypothetical protein